MYRLPVRDAQCQAVVFKFQSFSVEVDRDLIFASFRPACLAEQRHASESREIRGWQLQLDFDFLRSRHEFAPKCQISTRWKTGSHLSGSCAGTFQSGKNGKG